MTDGKPLRIALLGCGWHAGEYHAAPLAHYLSEHPDEVELVAACDLDPGKAAQVAKRFGFAAAYTNMDEMLCETGPDAVVCVMPIEHIVDMAAKLLQRGIPCTIEKPLGTSAEQAHALAEIARKTKTPHMVSVNRRYWPHLVKALEWIGDRPVRFIRATMLRHNRTEPQFISGTAIHLLDTMVHIAGEISAHEAHLVSGDEMTAKWFNISLEFSDGIIAQCNILPTCGRCEETYELFGQGYAVRVSMDATTMDGEEVFSLHCWEGARLVLHDRIADPCRPYLGFGSYGEVCALVKSLCDRTPLRPTVEDVLPATDLCFELAERFA